MSEIGLKRSGDFAELVLRKNDSARDADAAPRQNVATKMQSPSVLPVTDEWAIATQTTPPSAAILSLHDRLAELESENFRLQKLVLELLVKNQQLRDGSQL
jgi:hypothetical protein